MSAAGEIAVSALILFGAVFVLIGSYGLVRLPDLVTRLHAPTKATTLGLGAILLGSAAFFSVTGGFTARELLIAAFLFLTAPVGGLMIAKSWMLRRRAEAGRWSPDLPPPPSPDGDWAVFEGAEPGTVDRNATTG